MINYYKQNSPNNGREVGKKGSCIYDCITFYAIGNIHIPEVFLDQNVLINMYSKINRLVDMDELIFGWNCYSE